MQKLNIPKQVHVGYQNRKGTYTGKLAYIIYTDAKGKVRKENSWQSWRDNEIDSDDFDNEPTSGFVLNKGVGGQRQSWGWNARNEYIRIYDPRGFEFEISVANLLFILTECNAYKGKGLEGEFVYAWDGVELILLPVGCYEYKESMKFTALQSMKITKKDMREGLTYQHKNTNTLVYMGRHKIRNLDSWYRDRLEQLLQDPDQPRHVFWDVKNKQWHFERGFTKLAIIVSEESHPEFADLYMKFMESEYVSGVAKIVLSPITTEDVAKIGGYSSHWFYIKVDKGYQLVSLADKRYRHHYSPYRNRMPEGQTEDHFWPVVPVVVKEVTREILFDDHRGSHYGYDERHSVSRSYIEDKELFTPEIQLQSNKKLEVYNYVKRHKNQPVS